MAKIQTAPGIIAKKNLSYFPKVKITKYGGKPNDSKYGITFPCGELIAFGETIYLDTDGKLYKAGGASGEAAFGIALSTGDIDDRISIARSGIIECTEYNLEVGKIVYLNMTSNYPTTIIPSDASGNIFQRLGTAITTTSFEIDIQRGIWYE
ncbi:MAG: hypothetical protein ACLFQX_04135 [Candidatus Kapaibacterium sp.]